MTKPTLPTWATDANFTSGPRSGQPAKVDPSTAAAQGIVAGEPVHAGHLNYLLNLLADGWAGWLNESAAANLDDIGLSAYGDGSDGDVVLATGTTTTLVRDMYYNNLTLDGNALLQPNGHRIFVRGTLTMNGTSRISVRGPNGGSGASGGSPGGVVYTAASLASAGNGAFGGSSAVSITDSIGGDGGEGGSGAGGAGGSGGSAVIPAGGDGGYRHAPGYLGYVIGSAGLTSLQGGGGGGGGGAGAGADAGVSAGAGGSGGGVISLCALRIITAVGTTIDARGGDGGDGDGISTGSGGGAGGGGGGILIASRDRTGIAGTVTADGGQGGLGGTGAGVGSAGDDGSAGRIVYYTI